MTVIRDWAKETLNWNRYPNRSVHVIELSTNKLRQAGRSSDTILYEDLAMAIDGGKGSSDKGQNELLGCGKDGGQMGVMANTSNPLYNMAEYKSNGAKPNGIIIKLVKALPS